MQNKLSLCIQQTWYVPQTPPYLQSYLLAKHFHRLSPLSELLVLCNTKQWSL